MVFLKDLLRKLILKKLRVSGDPLVRPHPLDVIQYARSSYYYDNVYLASAKFDSCQHPNVSGDTGQISSSYG